jgi:gliding motility-associated-like protein
VKVTVNPNPVIEPFPQTNICKGSSATLTANAADTPSPVYRWSTGSSEKSIVVAPDETKSYSVTVTDANSCVSSISGIITVIPNAVIILIPYNSSICRGDAVTITASGSDSFSWSPPESLNTSTGSTVIATPEVSTTYTVTGSNNGICFKDSSFNITVNPIPGFNLTPDKLQLCSGDTLHLSLSGADEYKWAPSEGLSATSGSKVDAFPPVSSTYTITGSNGTCKRDTVFFINVIPNPDIKIFADKDFNICKGESININASGAEAFSWYPSTWLNTTSGSTVIATPQLTTTYTIEGTNSDVCSKDTSFTIIVNPLPIITPIASQKICYGDSASFSADVSGSPGPYIFLWSNEADTSIIKVKPAVSQSYYLTVTDANKCTATGSAEVTVIPNPVLAIGAYEPDICFGSSVSINVSGADTYKWSPSDWLNTATGPSVVSTPDISVTYTITGINGNLCKRDTTIQINVIKLDTAYTANPTEGNSPLTGKFAYKGYNDDITWDFGDGSALNTNKEASHEFKYNQDKAVNGITNYKVKLIIKQGECVDTIFINIEIKQEIYLDRIPDIFTPNGDKSNDNFSVKGKGLKSAEVKIFNRWGKKIIDENYDFSSTAGSVLENRYDLWNGKDKNDKEVPDGVYFYIIKPIGIDDKAVQPKSGSLNGSVTVVH